MGQDEPVRIPIEGVLDLHAFNPGDVKSLVPEYLGECLAHGITEVRLIHGRGSGTLRRTIRGLLAKDPRVLSFHDADPASGGWGATIVCLRS